MTFIDHPQSVMNMAWVILFLATLCLLDTGRLRAEPAMFSKPLSPRIANYRITVTLDTEKKTLEGKETLVWRNTSRDVIRELRFHLYLNAFKNNESTFMREGGRSRGPSRPADHWGWIDVTSMRTSVGEDLTRSINFVHPDDDNEEDRTVIRVPLAKPVLPGKAITLFVDFSVQLPQIFARTGFFRNYFMVGQWFPKIGVYEAAKQHSAIEGGWNCHQFHPNTEFYADFGVYDVEIIVPREYIVGATGQLYAQSDTPDGKRMLAFHAEDVHDFAWTAAKDYIDLTEIWRNVKIRVLMQPQRVGLASHYFQSARTALEYFDRYVGIYPYPTLTIVDPAYGAAGAGGMEYPTLITAGTFWGITKALRWAELVTIHEFGHQYWYGMSASNEFEEAWLDEGITQYYETRIMDETYGKKNSVLDCIGLHTGDFEMTRAIYTGMSNPRMAPVATPAWKFPRGGYGSLTYNKTAVFLTTLERMIGRPSMDSAMRTFFRRWKFKHPSGRDFISVFNEVVPAMHGQRFGTSLDWYFDQVLYGTGVCDYALTAIRNEQMRTPGGVSDTATYRSSVTVSRLGEITLPVTVLIRFEDGSEVREQWNGEGRTREFTYRHSRRIAFAQVDPDNQIPLDINGGNNSRAASPPSLPLWKYTARFLFWIQNLLSVFSSIT